MRLTTLFPAGLLAALLAFGSATAAVSADRIEATQEASPLLVEPAWLADHLDDEDLVVLHVGNPADYAEGHIPGSRQVALRDLAASRDGKTTEMLPADELRGRLEGLGISNGSRIVVYFSSGNFVTASTRIVLTLDYAGLGGRTSWLNGGFDAWTGEQRPVSQDATEIARGSLSSLDLQPRIATAEDVLEALKSDDTVVVDARAAAFYDGTNTGGGRESPQRTGHITGAKSVPFNSVVAEDLTMLDEESLRAHFREAGVEPGDAVIAYCHIGQQATLTIFAARLLGHRAQLYDGSFEDWSSHEDYPVTNPGGGR